MATYAAYRHVELDKVGCGKRSIMKPPGGDCHDIFGADFHGTPSHHRVLKPPGGGTSNLFANPIEEKPKQRGSPSTTDGASVQNANINGVEALNGKAGNDLDDIEPGSKFDIPESKENDLHVISSDSSNLSAEIKSLTAQEEKRQRDGNPVTGEGYDTPDTQPTVTTRTRIPPGGYSSGLW